MPNSIELLNTKIRITINTNWSSGLNIPLYYSMKEAYRWKKASLKAECQCSSLQGSCIWLHLPFVFTKCIRELDLCVDVRIEIFVAVQLFLQFNSYSVTLFPTEFGIKLFSTKLFDRGWNVECFGIRAICLFYGFIFAQSGARECLKCCWINRMDVKAVKWETI